LIANNPFSILARHGFIGRDLLFSLYNKKILNFNDKYFDKLKY